MILISGTIADSVKLQTLDSKWQQKKASGDILSKKERNERENWTSEDWLKHDFEEQLAQNREAGQKTDIDNKIMTGQTLTPEEEKYLEQNDPAALQKYKEIKAEKKAYEEKLKNCKTKDEVQRLKTETMGEYAAAMKKIENNPYIPMSEKLAKAEELLAKTRNVQEAELTFIRSSAYAMLPTEGEEAKERAEETRSEQEQTMEELSEATEDNSAEAEATDEEGEIAAEATDEEGEIAAEATDEKGKTAAEASDEKAEVLEEAAGKSGTVQENAHREKDAMEEVEEAFRRILSRNNALTDAERKAGQKVNVTV
jgi:hypothetical protein